MSQQASTCAHPACSCPAAPGSKYCSQYCKDVAGTTEISCNCGHAGCALEDERRHAA
jgi:hypothetical protein